MKISIKREQNQASLSFAERLRVGEPCSGMRKKFRPKVKQKRLLLLLALLMTAATGAWAQTSDKETPLTLQATADGKIYIYDPKEGMHYKVGNDEKQTITGTDYVAINVNEGQTVQFFGNGTEITAYGGEQGFTFFGSSVPCCIYGNIMSLVDEDDFAKATALTADYAFKGLFASFSNLSNHASRKLVLPATTLTKNCYKSMFEGCTGLTTAPALPATELAEQCYYCMFNGCSSLTTAPALPATELAYQCYHSMFNGCTSLTTAPALPATELAEQCYCNMFSGCTNLNAVTCLATDISAEYATDNWLEDVAATGTLTIAKGMEDKWAEKSTDEGIPSGWTTDVYGYKVKLADNTKDADSWKGNVNDAETDVNLPITKLEGGEKVTLKYNGRLRVKDVTATTDYDPLATPLTMEAVTPGTIVVTFSSQTSDKCHGMKYSVNGGTKTPITSTETIEGLKAGDKVQFYGIGTSNTSYGDNPEVKISGGTATVKVYGNIMSLLDETGFASKTELPDAKYVFYGLFRYNTTLIDASELLLPAATLTNACYQAMFEGCTSLTTAPKLPATTLAAFCYHTMFEDCENLTSAYVKAAYTLTAEKYECDGMFYGCWAAGAVLHTTPGYSKESWETKMGPNKDWETWTVADDWQD